VTEAERPTVNRGRLRVNGPELQRAITAIVGAQRRGNKVALAFDGYRLLITRASVSVAVPATGAWPDEAIIGPSLLRTVVKMKESLPEAVELTGSADHLELAFYRIRCQWKQGKR
jgi:hypothetical protein